jgi:uncharacterized HhH-GPD family protein
MLEPARSRQNYTEVYCRPDECVEYHARMSASMTPDRVYFTDDDEANRLIASDPMALLIGMVLDQQVTVQKAFSGPLELKKRLGTLDAATIAATDPARLEAIFRERPTIHRFPGSMARRVQEMCAAVATAFNNDPTRIWSEATDARDLEARLLTLPGIGAMKAANLASILARRFGIQPAGWDAVAPKFPTLGDVDSPEALARYRAGKAAYKAELREKSAR